MTTHVVNIEDDRSLRDILRTAFQVVEPRINLHQFSSAEEALPYIEQHAQDIDLFVLDIRLPGKMSGIEIVKKIRELNCCGRVVVSSAYSAPDEDVLNALNVEYMPKPWHIMQMTQRLLHRPITAAALRYATAK